jgi:hypothetical protein
MLIITKSFTIGVYAKGNKKSEKLALVLPGQLDTKDYPHMKSHVNMLEKLGFFALSFDPPGTWESPGSIDIYNMTNYDKAINEIIEHYGNKPTVVIGHSRGGSMAILAGINNKHVKGFVSIFSAADYTDYNRYKKESFRDLPENPNKRKSFILPKSFVEDSKKYNMLPRLKNCYKPKLFVFGKYDNLIKPVYIKEAYDISAQPKELVEFDSDHDYRKDPKLIEEMNEVIISFIKKYNL